MNDILKSLFSSATRVKLLATFLLHPDQEYFVRELTRLLDEQINSIRRELENLKEIGLVRSRAKNRRKYFKVNVEFPIFTELRNIFGKLTKGESVFLSELKRVPGVKLLVLAGSFVSEVDRVDLLLVGDISKEAVEKLLAQDPAMKSVKYSIFSQADFLYRLHLKDKFIRDIFESPTHVIALNELQKEIEEARK
ncbi:MAG: winged helix-turn-helix domain-containing protein [Patescibacteria group bacterium]